MGSFHLGCAIWAYKGWLGNFYPKGSAPSTRLKLYSDRFSTVECNATFYSIPSLQTVQKWARETPNGFSFCPKLPQSVTHQGILQPHIDAARRFLQLMDELGDRRGPIFAQLPPSYSPKHFDDLSQFLQGIQDSSRGLGVEVRHRDWFKPPYHQQLIHLLKSLKIGQVLLDTRPIYQGPGDPQRHSQRKKPDVPLLPNVTASFSVIRFISHPILAENQRFMEAWAPIIQDWLAQDIDIYFFMHCPIEEHSPDNARHFHRLLQKHQIPVRPLPWDSVAAPSTQLNLFSG